HHHAGDRCADMSRITVIGLRPGRGARAIGIGDANHARLAIEGIEQPRVALARGTTLETDDQRLAGIDIDVDFLPFLQSVEEYRSGQTAYIAVVAAVRGEIGKYLRVHQMGRELVCGQLDAELLLGVPL